MVISADMKLDLSLEQEFQGGREVRRMLTLSGGCSAMIMIESIPREGNETRYNVERILGLGLGPE